MKWLARHIPRRETIHENRLLRPFAKPLSNPALWRMTRRPSPMAAPFVAKTPTTPVAAEMDPRTSD